MEGVTRPDDPHGRCFLAYCTNVHPGDTLARTKAMLERSVRYWQRWQTLDHRPGQRVCSAAWYAARVPED